MCGISAALCRFLGAEEFVLNVLSLLEQRGYDSAGLSVLADGSFSTVKVVGATPELRAALAVTPLVGKVALGHTRWATTGSVSQTNAHPFRVGEVIGAANGDVTNHEQLKATLNPSTALTSEVDTEVAVAVVSEAFDALVDARLSVQERLLQAVRMSLPRFEGSFALAVGCDGFNGLIVLRHGLNNVYVGHLPGADGYVFSSTLESMLQFTQRYQPVEDGDLLVVTTEEVQFYEGEEPVRRPVLTSTFEASSVSLGEFPTFLEKEIFEQPDCIRRLITTGIPAYPDFARVKRAVVLACGSARYAAKVGQFLLEGAAFPTRVWVASEFQQWPQLGDHETLVIAVSQSGTTADVLEAVEATRKLGFGPLVVITNTPSSPLAEVADLVLPILSGPEISVASTKAVTSMVAVFGLLTQCLRPQQAPPLRSCAALIDIMLRSEEVDRACVTAARALVRSEQVPPILVIGQGVLHVAGREIALKVKELTAIPTESFPSRELKHGPIAMLKAGTPVIFCAVGLRENTVVNQVQSRGGFAIGIVEEGSPLADVFDLVIEVPAGPSPLEQFLPTLVAGQLIALKLTELLGKNPDRPANLAKSATTR